MLEADNRSAAVVIRTNSARLTRADLLRQLTEAGIAANATALSPVGIQLDGAGRVEELYGYAEGLWQVQDEAAQLVGIYAAIPEGARVLDACAAPGGKACHLAESHPVVAFDLHANKLRKISSEAKRLGLTEKLTLRAHDATTPLPEDIGEFDAVVVDAPCTGLGTLRRHPELRYRRAPEDVARLAQLQREILESCQEKVAPGGLLVYAVCSAEPQEGADQIEMFLRSHPEFTTEPPPASVAGKLPSWQGHLRTLPGPEGLDGFFAARLRKLY
jgi:16S rRNA (cytosine967-C5)-methyltransferase